MLDDPEDEEDWSVVLDSRRRIAGSEGSCLTDAVVFEKLVRVPHAQLSLLKSECHLAAWPLAQSSFWLPADASPVGPLEELAASVYAFHTSGSSPNDHTITAASGCEWWCNVTRGDMVKAAGLAISTFIWTRMSARSPTLAWSCIQC